MIIKLIKFLKLMKPTKFLYFKMHKKFTRFFWANSWGERYFNERDENYFELFAECVSSNVKHDNFSEIIEIGCAAGNFINCISKKIENCKKFIGLDINKKQIKKNIENYQGRKDVDFVYADIEDYIFQAKLGDNILFASQNTLDYFTQDRLERIFELIYKTFGQVEIAVSTHKRYAKLKSSALNEEHNFTAYHHNYVLLFENANYNVRSIDFEKDSGKVVIFASKD
jgi:trans-aconitate methyltransferase